MDGKHNPKLEDLYKPAHKIRVQLDMLSAQYDQICRLISSLEDEEKQKLSKKGGKDE